MPWDEIRQRAETSEVRCADPDAERAIIDTIDRAKEKGDTLGGVFEVVALGCPVGLGSYVQWDRRLDGRIAQALCSIQAIKGCEVGLGFETARRPGSAVHDEILFDRASGFTRTSNNAGGLEGGVTNGQPLVVRAAMKPISTLRTPLRSVDMQTKEAVEAVVERSDVCAVPAAGIVGEAMVAIVLADAFLEKFGGDSVDEIRRNYHAYQDALKEW
jgi:chorismate synthase